MTLLCPQGDSNPCLGLERAPSWATRRWGRLLSLTRVSDMAYMGMKRAGLYHSKPQSSTSVLAVLRTSVLAVPWTSVLAAICFAKRVDKRTRSDLLSKPHGRERRELHGARACRS